MLECNRSIVLKNVFYFYRNTGSEVEEVNFDAMLSVVTVHVGLF